MGRLARAVAIGLPHHITQQGINRDPVFGTDRSREVYLALLREHGQRQQLRILPYCLMTNHIHLLAIPEREDSLSRTLRYGAVADRFGLLDMNWWAAGGWDSRSWKKYLLTCRGEEQRIRLATFTGRPLGSDDFVRDLEAQLGRTLARQKRGPKPRPQVAAGQTGLF